MNLEELKTKWINNNKTGQQEIIWDNKAQDFAKKNIPNFESNDFLKLIQQRANLGKSICVLDIGCGTGIYSFALAKYIRQALGTDISSKMIQIAKDKAKELAITNVDFRVDNWEDIDIETLGWTRKFDIVLANMTPAITDYKTFDKMVNCSKNWCFMRKPVKRNDEIEAIIYESLGIELKDKKLEQDVEYILEYLKQKEYAYEVKYHQENWQNQKTIEEMATWHTNRIKLNNELNSEQIGKVYSTLSKLAQNGEKQTYMNNRYKTNKLRQIPKLIYFVHYSVFSF